MANEWEDAPAAWEDAPDGDSVVLKQLSKLKDFASAGISELGGGLKDIAGMMLAGQQPSSTAGDLLKGGAEAAGTIATGAAAIPGASVPAALQAANQMGQGESPTFLSNYEKAVGDMTYQPRTEHGQDAAQSIGEFINRNVVPLAGGIGHLTLPERPPLPMLEKFRAAAETKKAAKASKTASELQSMLADKNAGGSISSSVDADIARLHDQDIQGRLKEIDKSIRRDGETVQGQEPIYVDPQGQAFHGDPGEGNARLGLERQTEAADNAMTHNETPMTEEPLGLLRKDSFDPSNEGPQLPVGEEGLQHQFKAELADKAVSEHPFVRKAEERISKQEQLITKLSGEVEKGKAQGVQLARAVRDLENLEAALERTRDNVSKGVGEGRAPTPFNFRKQGGAINPEVFKEGFEKLKQLSDGTWLRAFGDGRALTIEARKDGHIVGTTSLDAKYTGNAKNLEAAMTSVKEEHRGKGLAKEMYSFASELGNDVRKSDMQTPDGKAMWNSFAKNGIAKGDTIPMKPLATKSPGNRQSGHLQIDPGQENQAKFLSENAALKLPTLVPMKLTKERVAEMAKLPDARDVDQNWAQKAINYGTKGGLYQALKTDNVFVKFTQEKLYEADRLSRGDIQQYVHDQLGTATRNLSNMEKAETWPVVSFADLHETAPNLERMATNGFNEKQLQYVRGHREVMDKAYDMMNKVRASLGMEPVTKRQAYAVMRSTGDYRTPILKVVDGEKFIVGQVGSNFRRTMDKQVKAILAEHPDYVAGEEKYYGGVPKDGGEAQKAMMEALQSLSDRDPHVKEFLDVLDQLNKNEVYSFLNMKKHTMQKKGVFGAEGRKPWEDATSNAKEGMQAQLNYAESSFKWGRFAEALEELRPLLRDQDIKMPVAKQWAQDFIKNALGYNPSNVGHFLEMAVAHAMEPTGMGYSVLRKVGSVTKQIINAKLLSLSPRFLATQFIQPFKSAPGMKAYLATKGLDLNFDLGTGYSYLASAAALEFRARTGKPLTAVEAGAYSYAKSHHVFGSDLIEHSNRASKDFGYYANKIASAGAGAIESGTRSVVFFGYVKALHENGLSVKDGLYETAHNITDAVMNNYSRMDRPRYLSSMGPVGETASNLALFKHNELSRTALYIRQLKEEKSARPLVVELTAGVAFAGIMGTLAFSEADQLYKFATKSLGHPDSLTMLALRLSEGAGDKINKATGAVRDTVGDARHALSHGFPSLIGLDMAKSLGLDNVVPDNMVDAAYPGASSLGTTVKTAYQAVAPQWMPGDNGGPSEMNTKRAIRELMPAPGATNMDLEWFSKGNMASNKETLKGQLVRNKSDVMAKRFGFTGIHESVDKAKKFEVDNIDRAYGDARKSALFAARDEIYTKGQVSKDTVMAYIKAQGDPNSLVKDLSRIAQEQKMPARDLDLLHSSMSKSITSLRHAQRLQEAYK